MDYGLFFQLIKFAPQLRLLQIGNSLDILQYLSPKIIECNGIIDIIIDTNINTISNVNVSIKDYNSDLKIIARNYEYVIICDIYDKVNDIPLLLETSYHSLENSAQIILICKKDIDVLHKLQNILENVGFRAINDIDISKNYYIITAKKLHMWGNGL